MLHLVAFRKIMAITTLSSRDVSRYSNGIRDKKDEGYIIKVMFPWQENCSVSLTSYSYDFSSGTAFQSSAEILLPWVSATHFQVGRWYAMMKAGTVKDKN